MTINYRWFENLSRSKNNKNNLLYIDHHILKDRKKRRENVAMAWIDNKKIYDMLLQSWIIDCHKYSSYPTNS